MNVVHSDRLNRDFDVTVTHIALESSPFGDKDDKSFMDHWSFVLGEKGRTETFDFWTGIGHRKLIPKVVRGHDHFRRGGGTSNVLKSGPWCDLEAQRKAIIHDSRPQTPKLDDLLCSLVTDAYATSMSFADWCAEFGYDEDSRKALATYEACQKNADRLRRLGVDLEKAREAFQDY